MDQPDPQERPKGLVPYIPQPVARVVAIPQSEAVDAMAEKLRALEYLMLTQRALLRALDKATTRKSESSKALDRAIRAAWDEFEKHNVGEDYIAVASILPLADVGAATREQLKALSTWIRQNREMYDRHSRAVSHKKKEVKRLDDKVKDLQAALRKCILGQQDVQADVDAATPGHQQDLPGFDPETRPRRTSWMDEKTRKTVIDTFATEVKESRKAIGEAPTPEAKAAAESELRESTALLDALKAMGLDVEVDQDEDAETGGEVADESELIDTTAVEVDPTDAAPAEPQEPDPTQHPALGKKDKGGSSGRTRKPPTNNASGKSGGKGKRK